MVNSIFVDVQGLISRKIVMVDVLIEKNRGLPTEVSDVAQSFRTSLGSRISRLIGEFGTRAEAGRVAGVTVEQLSKYERGEAKPPLETIARLAVEKGYSLDWIANGSGVPKGGEQEDVAEFALIPVWSAEASSGFGAFVDIDEMGQRLAFSRAWLRSSRATAEKNLYVVFNRGDSNEPDINHGDAMLVDRGVTNLSDDAYYVFDRSGLLLVKMIERMVDGHVILKSRNPRYSEQTLAPDEAAAITVFGRVLWRAGVL